MEEYEIDFIKESGYGVITYRYYQVTNYDGDVERLEKFKDELNNEAMFNISWRIVDKEKGILEKMIDTLD